VKFEISTWPPNEGHGEMMSGVSVDMVGGGSMSIDVVAAGHRVPGVYMVAKFPKSLMADLLLESQSGRRSSEDDPLSGFRWSGTSKEYVESTLRGPLLTWLTTASNYSLVEIRDETLLTGPLPLNPGQGARLVDEICTVIHEHFETWSMPEPDFGDDD